MTPEELTRLEQLCVAATEGPWRRMTWASTPLGDVHQISIGDVCLGTYNGDLLTEGDANFIAASRQAVPALIAEVRRLMEALAFYTAEETYKDQWNDEFDAMRSPVVIERGAIARAALEPKE